MDADLVLFFFSSYLSYTLLRPLITYLPLPLPLPCTFDAFPHFVIVQIALVSIEYF